MFCCALEDLLRSKRVNKIIASRLLTLADFDYSYLLCTTDILVEPSKPVVVRHPPPYFYSLEDKIVRLAQTLAVLVQQYQHQAQTLAVFAQHQANQNLQ